MIPRRRATSVNRTAGVRRPVVNRLHAVLGASDACIAVHPSDMCVALAALDAAVNVDGPDGKRSIAFSDFHRLPETSRSMTTPCVTAN
jgi:CO/xanthine dehydrogenase FAD-binding subunit